MYYNYKPLFPDCRQRRKLRQQLLRLPPNSSLPLRGTGLARIPHCSCNALPVTYTFPAILYVNRDNATASKPWHHHAFINPLTLAILIGTLCTLSTPHPADVALLQNARPPLSGASGFVALAATLDVNRYLAALRDPLHLPEGMRRDGAFLYLELLPTQQGAQTLVLPLPGSQAR